MIKKQYWHQDGPVLTQSGGFTLVELMITMVIFVLVMAAMSSIFSGLLTQFKQQSKIAETNIEGLVGLELLRYDIEQAGFGLPWDLSGVAYNEAVNDALTRDDTAYNDGGFPPRAIVTGMDAGLNGSDVLVLKAANVATNNAAHKWTYVINTGAANTIQVWNSLDDNLVAGDQVIALQPVNRVLINSGSSPFFYTTFNPAPGTFSSAFQPVTGSFSANLVYGISTGGTLRMPFNRADYYVRRPTTAGAMPTRCQAATGNLYKATVNQSDGKLTEMPLLDCVYDMQVIIGAETITPATGTLNAFYGDTFVAVTRPFSAGDTPAASATAAETIRNQARDVRVYIIAQEGQRDTSYTYTSPIPVASRPAGCVADDQICITDNQLGTPYLIKAVTVPDRNYRWKIYTLVATPYNVK
jgi:prepilin-type N-terminal cleavage/methylation domain-containing protein